MKASRIILFCVIGIILLAGAFSGGLVVGWVLPGNPGTTITQVTEKPVTGETPVQEGEATATPVNTETLFSPFWEAWDLVHNYYIDQPVDDTKLMQGAIRGMMEGLGDEHSSYMTPEEYQTASEDLAGKEYSGIGAWVDTTQDYVTIMSTMPGSPAEAADLRTGDQVIAIDGKDQTGILGDVALKSILGEEGTAVKLTIYRKATDETFDVVITRAKITVPSASAKMLDNGIAYVVVYQFGDKTTAELRDGLKTVMAQKPVGMVLDLRGNTGGYLNTAVEVVSEFIKVNQVAIIEEYGDGTRQELKTNAGGIATDIPLVVLVNGGTASAAEITAGAIQDYGRGKIVGTITYGKGTVQNWIPLQNDQGAIRVTIARWLTPKGNQINKVGIQPDYVVELTEDDVANNRDPQLDKAIELLLQEQ
jgi:carboxyl-terminal processing protease